MADRLVRETPTARRFNGQVRVFMMSPLLAELQAAAHPSGESGGAGSSSPSPGLPLDAGALDLLAGIHSQVNHEWWLSRSATHRSGGLRLAEKLGWWIEQIVETQDVARLETARGLLRLWVEQIERLFDPPKVMELGRPCPSCHATRHAEMVDGESVTNAAFVATIRQGPPSSIEISCRACRAWWPADELEEVAALARRAGGGE